MSSQRTTDHFNARTSPLTRAILGRTTEAQIRSDLSVLQAGTADAQVRTNLQNDGRFAQLDGENWGGDGLGGLGYGGILGSGYSVDFNQKTTAFARAVDGAAGSPTQEAHYGFVVSPSTDNNIAVGIRDNFYYSPLGSSLSWRMGWDDNNLPDPARIGQSQTFTGNNTFDRSNIRALNIRAAGQTSARISYGISSEACSAGFVESRNSFEISDPSPSPVFGVNIDTGDVTIGGTINGGALPNGAGEVGTYAFARREPTGSNTLLGSNVAGSELSPADNNGSYQGATLSGTWRCMGYVQLDGDATTWLRIS